MGMADTLIARLSGSEISVRPVSSVRKYVELDQDPVAAGHELGVELVLEGSIQRSGDSIRITVRLIKTADGTSLWAGTFDEKFTDIFAVQDAIANKVAAALSLRLGGEEQKHLTRRDTDNVEAYQSYLKGRFHWNKRGPQDLQKAIEHFKQATALDPDYALAYAGLADAYTLLANAGSPAHEIMPKAREAAQKAVSLDDNLAEAHAAYGNIIIYYDYDFVGAEREEQRAIELNPDYATAHHWYSELLMGLGRHEEALAEIRRALEIDPLSLILNRQYGASLLFARQYDAAVEQMKKTVDLDANFAVGHSTLSVAYRMRGDYAESVEELAKFQELTGGERTAALMRESFAEGGWQEFLRAMTDERRPASLTPYNVATFHAALGEKDKAFAELNKAYQNREGILGLLKVDPRFDSLHDDPRFDDLARRFKIAP
jgi:tetratricopeptide (TPR) repeat protein